METKVILLVDDNQGDVVLTKLALEKTPVNCRMDVAKDGKEALDYLFGEGQYAGRDLRQMPAAVLLDLRMPLMDGLEVLKKIRANPATNLVPVVIVTASPSRDEVVAAYQLGCNSFINKPVDYNQFARELQTLEAYWLTMNQTAYSV